MAAKNGIKFEDYLQNLLDIISEKVDNLPDDEQKQISVSHLLSENTKEELKVAKEEIWDLKQDAQKKKPKTKDKEIDATQEMGVKGTQTIQVSISENLTYLGQGIQMQTADIAEEPVVKKSLKLRKFRN